MLVKYDKTQHKRAKTPQAHTFTTDPNYDPNKILEKVNNHKKTVTPNFNLMTSRPNEDKILPSYMQKIHSRQATNIVTEKTLKMNNFSEGKFSQSGTSFWPKKSFNKIVNLNLLNSVKFLENAEAMNAGENGQMNEINNYIQKSMKFYSKI